MKALRFQAGDPWHGIEPGLTEKRPNAGLAQDTL